MGIGWRSAFLGHWDAIGVPESVERMRPRVTGSGECRKMLASGATAFYKNDGGHHSHYDLVEGCYKPMPARRV